eukprot:TRINITY_DN2200_c0_g1_i5.p1 TRINITY_DN2200_c0_g1~~TRINITY_DN2200_c0_g1_i5.p1  ORF type:complete len:175 (+),score=1.39 TRINITY_DN2200_c0_g1_i5:107-631(+)
MMLVPYAQQHQQKQKDEVVRGMNTARILSTSMIDARESPSPLTNAKDSRKYQDKPLSRLRQRHSGWRESGWPGISLRRASGLKAIPKEDEAYSHLVREALRQAKRISLLRLSTSSPASCEARAANSFEFQTCQAQNLYRRETTCGFQPPTKTAAVPVVPQDLSGVLAILLYRQD